MKPLGNQPACAAATLVVAALAFAGMAGLGGGGCASKLETGYKPRLLGSSAETRRGYYAQDFTPEAKKAKDYEQTFGNGTSNSVRPRPGD